jgi:hypothetical protein
VSTILLSCKWQCTSKSGVLVIAIAMAFQASPATLPCLPSFPSSSTSAKSFVCFL